MINQSIYLLSVPLLKHTTVFFNRGSVKPKGSTSGIHGFCRISVGISINNFISKDMDKSIVSPFLTHRLTVNIA